MNIHRVLLTAGFACVAMASARGMAETIHDLPDVTRSDAGSGAVRTRGGRIPDRSASLFLNAISNRVPVRLTNILPAPSDPTESNVKTK